MWSARIPLIYVASLLAMFFFACEDSTSASGVRDSKSVVDTVYVVDTIYKMGDSIVVTKKDTVILKADTVVVRDTVLKIERDTIHDTLDAQGNVIPSCGDVDFDSTKQFCYQGKAYPLCKGKTYNTDSVVCVNDIEVVGCGGTVFDSTKSICYKNKPHERYVQLGNRRYEYFVDERDDQYYRSVRIGNQVWMAQNLNYKVDSSWCAGGHVASFTENTLGDCEKYGRYYRWAGAMNIPNEYNYIRTTAVVDTTKDYQGACPNGWHVPNHKEWYALEDYIYTVVDPDSTYSLDVHLKSDSLWADGYEEVDGEKVMVPKGRNTVGFNALPVGWHYISVRNDGVIVGSLFLDFTHDTRFWSVNETGESNAFVYAADHDYNRKTLKYYSSVASVKHGGWSLRCIKNAQ